MTTLLAVFAGLALFLAAVGVYGVTSYIVSQRTHEIGLSMALGAGRGTIVKLVLGKGGKQLAHGIIVGLLLGAGLTRPLQFILYGVEVGDPMVYGTILATLALSGLLACLIPARSATRTDPMVAMRPR